MTQKRDHIVIVGGGTAGWLTAGLLASRLGCARPGGVAITLIESPIVPSIGVGEGTLPSLRLSLATMGVDEAAFMRACDATFKQGIHFADWYVNGEGEGQSYFHPFQSPRQMGGVNLSPYWSLMADQLGCEFAAAVTPQYDVYRAGKAPKRLSDEAFSGPLNYAYHIDVFKFADFLKSVGLEKGVTHILDHVQGVELNDTGEIDHVITQERGVIKGDLFIDCTGFSAHLLGKALGQDLTPIDDILFCDRAVALPVPYERADQPIPCVTRSSAQENGWTWEISLKDRRGVGYVYSSRHTDPARAEDVLRTYLGPIAEGREARHLAMQTGYRKVQWKANCVAIGLSAGFLEPLESTGILLVEAAATLLGDLFARRGSLAPAAKVFNRAMVERFENAIDFVKMHFALSNRDDTAFWRDNRNPQSWPQTLKDKLDVWAYRMPSQYDLTSVHETFRHINYEFILLGLGRGPDLSDNAAAYPYIEQAKREFAAIRQAGARAIQALPDHRALIEALQTQSFGAPLRAGMRG
ncbi:tryptophan halogenase family protein [Woodsholea maritima]|uniref:tryptophan halogenase family protein n=1 Tax=Woodsholea maritima TaxID=240237 RepID=UPI00039A2F99|nr:tryptophan halogenase family protein [Woodsholea maritima]